MGRWMKCVLWAFTRSFEEGRNKDAQLTQVKHERLRIEMDCKSC